MDAHFSKSACPYCSSLILGTAVEDENTFLLIGTWNLWPVCFAFNAVPALTCLVLFPLCPESPRFLMIKKNDEDGAKKGICHWLP